MTAIAAYLRVSSRAQTAESQRSAIERAASARGDTIATFYSEKRSGKTLARPELDRLREDVRGGHVRRLYVFRLDRLTRSGIADTLGVLQELRAHGCQVVSVADGFDLDGPAAEIVIAVMSWAAKMERLAIAERIAAARDRLEAEGKPWGRPPTLYGPRLLRAIELRAQGQSIRSIASALKIPRSTVAAALARSKPSRNPPPAIESTEPAPTPSESGSSALCTSETGRGRP